jgi:2-hydroxy-3-keto-5-methylthiopentenyl-1-phosphate phosphatase
MIIISDFSKTFTTADMPTTWSVFAKSGTLGDAYIHDRNALYEMHYPREIAGDVANTEEWFSLHIELFAKYQLTLEQIDAMVTDDRYFASRAGVAEFLDAIQEQDIPLYIVSSGISIFIERWFELRFGYTPDIIIANEMILENGVVVWVDRESAICPLDKSIELEFDRGGQDIILIGDNTEDTKVVSNPTQTIGFTDEERGFDITLWKDANIFDILKYV